ncbi:unnamed protein product [Parnassius apollo]|uniref:(apollo) hypothetical protein n=1 Tax=Parnassius apollo TaxID=110799 RepID=A0A8S3VZ69_PARAO|nr:unnamed protein product [Parnassius apollo]
MIGPNFFGIFWPGRNDGVGFEIVLVETLETPPPQLATSPELSKYDKLSKCDIEYDVAVFRRCDHPLRHSQARQYLHCWRICGYMC